VVLTGLPPLRDPCSEKGKGLWLGRSIIVPAVFIAVPGATRHLQADIISLVPTGRTDD